MSDIKTEIEPISNQQTKKVVSSIKSSNSIHPSGDLTSATTLNHSSASNKRRSKNLSGMSTRHDSNHRRHHSSRVQSPPTSSSTALIVTTGQQPPSTTAQYPCQRFSSEMLTYFLFLTSFFLSLSVYSIGQASGRVTVDTTDPKSDEHAGTYGVWTFLGFLGVLYSMVGFVMNCLGKLPFKVRDRIIHENGHRGLCQMYIILII